MNKYWLTRVFCSVVLLTVLLSSPILSDGSRCGDANGDGGTNVGDAVYLISYVFKGGLPPDTTCCETNCPPVVVDYDGNTYFTVKIGDQCWMAQNLKVTHYRNGDPIPNVTDGETWSGLSTGAYCDFGNDINNVATYGRLYNWHAVADARIIAPAGWHVATDDDWKQLEMYLGMSQAEADAEGWRGTDEGGKLREAGTTHWASPNTGATNESGFTALPGGTRFSNGYFDGMGTYANFWSSSELSSSHAWYRGLYYLASQVTRSYYAKPYGFSVRCVRD